MCLELTPLTRTLTHAHRHTIAPPAVPWRGDSPDAGRREAPGTAARSRADDRLTRTYTLTADTQTDTQRRHAGRDTQTRRQAVPGHCSTTTHTSALTRCRLSLGVSLSLSVSLSFILSLSESECQSLTNATLLICRRLAAAARRQGCRPTSPPSAPDASSLGAPCGRGGCSSPRPCTRR